MWVFLLLASCWELEKDNTFVNNETTFEDMKDDFLGTKKILALWDSLTAWYWVDISENYPSKLSKILEENGYSYEIVNAWVSGDTSENLLERADWYLEEDPDILLLVIWWNDWLQKRSTQVMKENILEIIDMFHNWETKIVLWWMQIPPNLGLTYSREFNRVYEQIAQEENDIYLHKDFLQWVAWYARYNLQDKIHPNREWYDIIVENLYEFLVDEDIVKK